MRRNTGLKLHPYVDYIKDRINKYNLSTVRILEEIRKMVYTD